ncbi:MAG: PqqD family peptide modification chaperone [Acidobacteriota bacterium]|nr:PqqD family peptide modification chaperone [Acidobacteriota bacterium]
MTLSRSSTVRRNPDLLHAVAGDDILMMSVEAGTYFGLEQVGARIWELVADPITVEQICARLIDEYDVGSDVCEAEVLAFLAHLAEQHIIYVAQE